MGLMDKLSHLKGKKISSRGSTVWEGPQVDSYNGGITFSMLSRFLVDRERFRRLVVEGIKPREKFDSKMEFGNMWHICEETSKERGDEWVTALSEYCQKLDRKFTSAREDIQHWYSFCIAKFPVYLRYWETHNVDGTFRIPPVSQMKEEKFNVAYYLPSGRCVYIRGKWDAITVLDVENILETWIDETKSKSTIDSQKIERQLNFDLQTMMYVVALKCSPDVDLVSAPFKGIRYNVVRRSAHKSLESLNKKMSEDIGKNRGNEWFSRWEVEIFKHDIEIFIERTFNPILEQLCDWWAWIQESIKTGVSPFSNSIHFQYPFGVYNVLLEGGTTDLDTYLMTGNDTGLMRTKNLFPELQE